MVYTAANADYPSRDEALREEVPAEVTVIRQPIREPYGLYRKLTGRKADEQMQSAFNVSDQQASLLQRFAVWVRSNFFIPDARKWWIKPSARFLAQWLRKNTVDVVVTNGTPHSCHLIGLRLKKQFPQLPWLADFRDPWTGIDYFGSLPLSPRARARHEKLEKEVMQTADYLTTVSWQWQKDFQKIAEHQRVGVVTNGYDASQYTGDVSSDPDFSLYHTGVLGRDRNYPALWRALQRLLAEEEGFATAFRLVLIGENDGAVGHALQQHGLLPYLDRHAFLPHEEVIHRIRGGQLLLLLINQSADAPGRLPSKLYEYLGAERPVLALSPLRGDAARILQETRAGSLFLPTEETAIRAFIRDRFRAWKAGENQAATQGYAAYSRYETTRKMAHILDSLLPTAHG